jgi:hypothetical protein
MSYFGRKQDAAKDCVEADIQIDGHDASNTSPVLHGGSFEGMAPMSGPHNFSNQRQRPALKPSVSSMRRTFPTEGVSGGS